MAEKRAWAGFWPRVFAFIIDGVIMGVAGALIGFFAFDRLAGLGSWARLIGLAIGLLYFGLLAGPVGRGQTLGMRALKLRVVRLDGRPLDLAGAVGRAAVLVAPFILNNIELGSADSLVVKVWLAFAVFAIFGIGLAQLYLLLFAGPDRRLLHDVLFGTAVVRADVSAAPAAPRSAHRVVAFSIAGLVLACALVLSVGGLSILPVILPASWQSALTSLGEPQRAVSALPEVISVSAQSGTTVMAMSGQAPVTTHFLAVRARLREWPSSPDKEADRIARTVLQSYRPEPGQKLTVSLQYGFDMGIASGWRGYTVTDDPGRWRSAPTQAQTHSI